jgi:clan AA aspartic protease (TIGR02281 family)
VSPVIALMRAKYYTNKSCRTDFAAAKSMLRIASLIAVSSVALGLAEGVALADDLSGCNGQSDEAIAACSTLISSGNLNQHDLADAYSRRGFAWERQGYGDKALADYDQVIRMQPIASAYIRRGSSRMAMGNFDWAIADFDQAIRLDPKLPSRYLSRGDAWKLKGNLERARADYGSALDRAKTDAVVQRSARDHLAELSATGLAAACTADRSACLAADESELFAFENRIPADDLASMSMTRHCTALLSDGKLSGHELGLAYSRRGVARYAQGYLDSAIVDFNLAIRLDPKDVRAFTNMGRAHQLKGDLTNAIFDWDRAIKLDSENEEAIVLRGIAFQAKGYTSAAVRDFDWAISLEPENPVAHYNRGSIWESTGDIVRARADYTAAVKTNPKTPEAFKAERSAHRRLAALPKEEQITETPDALNPSPLVRVSLRTAGGTFVVPVEVNGAISLNFILDTGAADVAIPADVVSTLIRTGTIQKSDFVGTQSYVLADGSESPSATFVIRSLKIGDKLVENIKGSVAPAAGALLLGQSFLQHFKSWSIDNSKHELLLESR